MEGDELFIQGSREDFRLKLTDVERVSASEWMNPETVTFHLKQRSRFGTEVKFMPGYRLLPWPDHPTALELSALVKKADSNDRAAP